MEPVGSCLRRRVAAAATLMSMVLAASLAAACGPDGTTRTPEVSSSPAEVADDVFESQTSDVIDMAARSGGDRCQLAATSPLLVSPPADAHQRSLLAEAVTAWTTAAAPHLEPADASLLDSAAAQLLDPTTAEDEATRADEDARLAIERFVELSAAGCATEDAPHQTVP